MKTDRTQETKLCNIFMVVMLLHDANTKNQVASTEKYSDPDKKLDSHALLNIIKKLVYTGGTNKLNTIHNKARAHLNLMNLHQDRFQPIQDLRDQYLATKKVLDTLQLCFGRCKDDEQAVLKEKGMTNPMDAQLNKDIDKIEEEHHVIMLMYKVDRQRYGKLLEQMENNVLQKKVAFTKLVNDACRILAV